MATTDSGWAGYEIYRRTITDPAAPLSGGDPVTIDVALAQNGRTPWWWVVRCGTAKAEGEHELKGMAIRLALQAARCRGWLSYPKKKKTGKGK